MVIHMLGDTFLRRPHGAEWAADVVRLLVLLSVPVAAVAWGPIDLAVMLLALLGAVLPRIVGLRPGVDLAIGLLSFVAAWSSTLEWYTTVFLWDKLVHFALTGALALFCAVVAADLGITRDLRRMSLVAAVLVCTAGGMAIGALWEMCEWGGHTFLDSSIFVGYDDTIGDLAADSAGALAAGFVVRWAADDRRLVMSRR